MRLVVVVMSVTGCGRWGFAPLDGSADAASDASGCRWQPFGPASRVAEVNSTARDLGPEISSDARFLYFSRGPGDLYVASRADPTLPFETPTPLATVNSPDEESSPSPSFDHLSLAFASARAGSLGLRDLWIATRPTTADVFSAPVHLAALSSASDEASPLMSADGLRIYFSSDRGGSFDLYVATRSDTNAVFGSAVLLGGVNTTGAERSFALAFDETEIMYNSDFGASRFELWIARRSTREEPFGSASLVTELNTPGDESAPSYSLDGTTVFANLDIDLLSTADADIWSATRACTNR